MSEFSVMTMEAIEAAAAKVLCSVVVAKANELQFDLDSDTAYESFQHFYHIKLASRFKYGLSVDEWPSKSGKRHVVVTLPQAFSVPERIAMQSQGGSDTGREFAALACHWDGSKHPILLFRPFLKTEAVIEVKLAPPEAE
jgi:hypothetical protein